VFTSNRGGTGVELFEKAVTGATEERSRGAKTEVPESWSPDGRFLLYANFDASTGTDLWALPMVGDPKAFPVVQTRFEERRGQFSPDGRWVAYESNESGQFEIYARAFPGSGARWQVSTAGGMQVRWRRDGKELFYVAPDGTMMAASISVSADRQTLNAGQPIALFKTHLATGGGVTANRAQYDVAADGRFLLNTNVDDSVPAPPITIVQNWQAALGK
jgi:Tol biopolymer transport system component